MNKQRGFTATEIVALAVALIWVAALGGIIYVAVHFIAKFW